MRTLKALKARREGIEKINKITRAMEVIAATRLRRYEEQVLRLRAYIWEQRTVMANLAQRGYLNGPTQAQDKNSLVILISSDRGFCGGFNNQLFSLIKSLQLESERQCSFIAVGKKGARYLNKQRLNVIEEAALPNTVQLSAFVEKITTKVIFAYRQEQQRVELIFNQFRRNLLGQGSRWLLLPLAGPEQKPEELVVDYLFEPDVEAALEEILPVYVRTEIKAAILESQAAEEMARMVAMTQARRSGEDLIESLTLEYHKFRQAGITRELIEIVNAV